MHHGKGRSKKSSAQRIIEVIRDISHKPINAVFLFILPQRFPIQSHLRLCEARDPPPALPLRVIVTVSPCSNEPGKFREAVLGIFHRYDVTA